MKRKKEGSWRRKRRTAGVLWAGEKVKESGCKRRVLRKQKWRAALVKIKCILIANDKSTRIKLRSAEYFPELLALCVCACVWVCLQGAGEPLMHVSILCLSECIFLCICFWSDKWAHKSTVQGDGLKTWLWSHGPMSQNQTFVQIKLHNAEIELHSHDDAGTKDDHQSKISVRIKCIFKQDYSESIAMLSTLRFFTGIIVKKTGREIKVTDQNLSTFFMM